MYTTIQKFGVSKIYFLKLVLLFSKDGKIDSKDVTFFKCFKSIKRSINQRTREYKFHQNIK